MNRFKFAYIVFTLIILSTFSCQKPRSECNCEKTTSTQDNFSVLAQEELSSEEAQIWCNTIQTDSISYECYVADTYK